VSVRLPLPEPTGLPKVVLFHREHPSEPRLVLQVPDPGAENSETYVVRLDLPAHKAWMDGLERSRELLDLLKMEMHVAYEPATGWAQPLQDLDAPPPFMQDIQDARRKAGASQRFEHYFSMRRTRVPAMSRFRMSLLGRPTRGV